MPKNRVHLLVAMLCIVVVSSGALHSPVFGYAEGKLVNVSKSLQYQAKVLKSQIGKSKSTINFWRNRGRWALHGRYENCWQVQGSQRQKVCRKSRESMRYHLRRLKTARNKLEKLTMVVGNRDHWECIYSHERGADGWQTNTGNGYYGGLQMDRSFQRAHGLDLYLAKGTADNWTSLEQMMVAERARRGIRTSLDDGRVYQWQDRPRGYNPWPNTARTCGLL